MNIKEVTVTASVSKNYQKGEFTVTATVENDSEIESLKELCKRNAIDILNSITGQSVENPTEELEEQPVRRTIIQQPTYTPSTTAPKAKKRPSDCKVGETYSFKGVIYKLCQNKSTGDIYWFITDERFIDDVHPKYHHEGLK